MQLSDYLREDRANKGARWVCPFCGFWRCDVPGVEERLTQHEQGKKHRVAMYYIDHFRDGWARLRVTLIGMARKHGMHVLSDHSPHRGYEHHWASESDVLSLLVEYHRTQPKSVRETLSSMAFFRTYRDGVYPWNKTECFQTWAQHRKNIIAELGLTVDSGTPKSLPRR